MAKIKSRKHLRSTPLVALAATLPLAAHATPKEENVAKLPTIEVAAEQDSYKVNKASSAKFTQDLVNTTQTVSIISEKVLKEQNATTLTEALRNVPGVGTFSLGENGRMNTGDAISMRGFDTANSIFVDGVRDLGNVTRDMFNTETVEVFKGPAGTDNGRTASSGSINLTTKQPKAENFNKASLGFGSDEYYRATADSNLKINDTTAIRLNAMGEKSNGIGRDWIENNKWGVAPSIAFGLGTDLRVYLDYLHIDQNNVLDGGVSTVGLPGFKAENLLSSGKPIFTAAQQAYLNNHKVDSSDYYGSVDDFDDVRADMATARLEYDFSDTTKLSNISRWGKTTHQYLTTLPFSLSIASATTDASQTQVGRSTNNGDTENKILTNQTSLVTSFSTGSLKHDLSSGVELTREEMNTYGWTGSVGTATKTSLYHPDRNLPTTLTRNIYGDTSGEMDTYSVFAFDTIEILPQFSVNAGVRLDHYKLDSTSWVNTAASGQTANYVSQNLKDDGNLFNWKVGGLFKPTKNGSLYANYSVQQQPPGTITGGDGIGNANVFAPSTGTNSGNNLSRDPQKTNTVEVGTKWEFFKKRLLLTSALYQTEQTNELEKDATSGIYYQNGKKTVKGVELGAVGVVTDNIQVTAGYSYQKSKIDNITVTANQVAADGSDEVPFTPTDSFTLWSTYTADKWSIGSGARYMGEMKKSRDGNAAGPAVVPDYWVFDSMISYQATKNIGVQFNINNLFDEDYISSINRGGLRYIPGAERNYRLTLNFNF